MGREPWPTPRLLTCLNEHPDTRAIRLAEDRMVSMLIGAGQD